jgi:hypothetical protein
MRSGSNMTLPPRWAQRSLDLSEEIINSFVDRQLAEEDNLAILQRASRDKRLVHEIRERRRLKHLLGMAYAEPANPYGFQSHCSGRFRGWWPWA